MPDSSRHLSRWLAVLGFAALVVGPARADADEGAAATVPPPIAPASPSAPSNPGSAAAPTVTPPASDPDALATPAGVAPPPAPLAPPPAPPPATSSNAEGDAVVADASTTRFVITPPYVPALSTIPTLSGPVGLLHASTAEVGLVRQLRFALRGEYFGANDFLIEGDSDKRLAAGFVVGYTPRRDLELFAAILNSSNRNKRDRDIADRDAELIKTFGDLVLGGKWIFPLSPAATIGVELGLKFLAGISDLALSPSSTSWWLGPVFTYDFREGGGFPLRLHAASSFYADNSSNLHTLKVPAVTRNTKEAAMFAYGIGPSRLRLSLAVDAPLEQLFPTIPFDPFIEYHVSYVTADADPDFADFMAPSCGGVGRPCVDNRDLQWLTLGVRANVFRNITVDLGIDIRVRSPGFPYGPPLPPWNFIFGVSYPLDLDSLTRTVVVTRTIEKAPPPSSGQVAGFVRNARGGAPIPGALVAVAGRARSTVASEADGGFQMAALPPGPVQLTVTAPDFEPGKAAATVVAGKTVEVAATLEPTPLMGKVRGRVTSATGEGVEASIRFAGADIREARSDATGAFAVALPVGSYRARADAPGLTPKEAEIDVATGPEKQLDFLLRSSAPPNASVFVAGNAIKSKKPIRFVGTTSKLDPASEKVLDAVAGLLELHPEIKRVRITAHWDTGLPPEAAQTLTVQQAEAVRAYLVGRGIDQGRLAPEGVGGTKPLVPNLTPANRSRNRRVELHLD